MINLGILSTARISRALFQNPLKHSVITAVASRDMNKANMFADEYKILKRYGSYEALLADKEIDAVYIGLPQHLHHRYVIEAANHGKHVLVEKPSALSTQELLEMSEACKRNNVIYMEAFMYRFLGIHRRIKEVVNNGTIGELRYINFNFGFDIERRGLTGFRRDRNLGGGALYDLGIYGIDFIRDILGKEPKLLHATVRREAQNGIDLFTHAVFQSENVIATLTCSFDMDGNYLSVSGRDGMLYSPLGTSGKQIPRVLHFHFIDGEKETTEHFPSEDGYNAEVDYFAQCIERKEEPIPGMDNSLANMKILEEIFTRG